METSLGCVQLWFCNHDPGASSGSRRLFGLATRQNDSTDKWQGLEREALKRWESAVTLITMVGWGSTHKDSHHSQYFCNSGLSRKVCCALRGERGSCQTAFNGKAAVTVTNILSMQDNDKIKLVAFSKYFIKINSTLHSKIKLKKSQPVGESN